MPLPPLAPRRRPARLARALAALLLAGCGMARAAVPSTFGTVIGNAVLCLDQVDNFHFYFYLTNAFGTAYKREGGAYWFKTDDATLWGESVTDVIVSDDSSPLTFIGAIVDAPAEKVEQAIINGAGLHYVRMDATEFPVRESNLGGRIVYFSDQSKVYCAKYKPLPRQAP